MSNELALRQTADLASLESDQRYGSLLFKSGLFQDTKSEAQAAVKVMAGRELGLSPFVAMRDLSIIQGNIALAGAQIAAKIQAAGGEWQPVQYDDKACVLRFSRNGKVLTPNVEFNMQHAAALGLAGKDNYRKQPRVMLYWRAITMGARMFFPSVFNGPIYTPEELTAGAAEVSEPVGITTATAEPPAPAPTVTVTLEPEASKEVETLSNPWMWVFQGTDAAKASVRGKHLAEMPTSAVEAITRASFRNKILPEDLAHAVAALDHPDMKEFAIAEIKAQQQAEQRRAFDADEIPNFDQEVA